MHRGGGGSSHRSNEESTDVSIRLVSSTSTSTSIRVRGQVLQPKVKLQAASNLCGWDHSASTAWAPASASAHRV